MTTNSTWAALRNPAFRKLWIAAVMSGTCVAAHDSAAIWMMNIFTGSPLLLSLMSTVAAMPFFLFTLPAGALADRVDRRKLVCTINVCMAATAFALAVFGWLRLLNPYLILGCVFFIGVGFAINAPSWTSIVRQIVSDAELPSAATLGSLQFSIAGIIGPALGGLLVLLAGANFVFALNAACFLLVVVAARQWKQPTRLAKPPPESFFRSFGTIVRHVRNAPGFQAVLARNFLFALFISAIPALIPVVGLKVLHLSASNLGLLFTSLGAGSVVGAVVIIPWLRARLSPDYLILSANLLLVLVYVLMALVRQAEAFFVVAALAGVGWTMSASELWVAAQRVMPSWARGRMNATVIVISQGAMALGGVIWGSAGAMAGTTYALLGAAVLLLASLLLARRLSINFGENPEEKTPAVSSVRVEPTKMTHIALRIKLRNARQENGVVSDPLIFTRCVVRLVQTLAKLAAALAVIGAASKVSADEVSRWNQVATDASAVANTNPLAESRVLAILHVAIHDAVNAIQSHYEPYQPRTSPAPARASVEAAIARAGHDTLVALLPESKVSFDAALEETLRAVADDSRKNAGGDWASCCRGDPRDTRKRR
jgi:MFS family permease